MNLCLDYAEKNAGPDETLQTQVAFTRVYLAKLNAIQTGNKEVFSQANEDILLLSEKGSPLATHILAKEMYKVASNMNTPKEKKNKREMLSKALELFSIAAEKGSMQSFYYMGEMAQNGDAPGGVDMEYAFECYSLAAANGSAMGYFKLALL